MCWIVIFHLTKRSLICKVYLEDHPSGCKWLITMPTWGCSPSNWPKLAKKWGLLLQAPIISAFPPQKKGWMMIKRPSETSKCSRFSAFFSCRWILESFLQVASVRLTRRKVFWSTTTMSILGRNHRSWWSGLPSLKLTCIAPENRLPIPKKEAGSAPFATNFQGLLLLVSVKVSWYLSRKVEFCA